MAADAVQSRAPRLIRVGHSPDPDDAFMFYGLASGAVDTRGFEFEHVLNDIQTLNDWAKEGRLETTAISVHAYAYVAARYDILAHGASMGEGYGPVVVARDNRQLAELRGASIAVPGLLTSAYLELRLRLSDFEPVVVPFDQIMDAVLDGRADAGLLIHEGQLTHTAKGLYLVDDLGLWWRDETGLPLPLGVNAIRRDLGDDATEAISKSLKESIEFSLAHRDEALAYAKQFGRGLDDALNDEFVGMYVNDRTLDMGDDGRAAIRLLFKRGAAAGLIPEVPSIRFVD